MTDCDLGLDAVMQMRPVSFTWNDKTLMDGTQDIGFIAQEQKAISEYLVCEDMEYMTLRQETLNPMLVKAIQELTARVEQLEAQLEK